YAGLLRYGTLRAGERLLVQSAAGGVGIAATQIGKKAGAEIFGTASASKHDAIRGFGVSHPIDYRTQDFAKEVRRITGEKALLDLIRDGSIRPVVAEAFPLERGADAHRFVAERKNIGKVVLTV